MPIETNQKHVAVLAFPSSSHPQILMNILLKISNSAPNSLFSFFNTKKSNNSLLSSSSSDLDLPDNIKIHNVEDGVPLGYKLTGKPHEQIDLFLKSAPQSLTTAIQTAVAETGIKISCVISDAFLTFSGEIAESFNASWIAVWQALPTSLSAHFHTRIIRDKFAAEKIGSDDELDFVPGLAMLHARDLPTDILSVREMESVFSKTLSHIGEKLPKATAVAVNCFQELVPEILHNDLNSKFNNYLNVGFVSMSLPPPRLPESVSDQTGCLSWLDTQSSKSVAYISFGTIVTLREKEIKELAEALESSKIPFLWSLKDNLVEKLPKGFIERTKQQGKVVPWAPQSWVLAHDSVAVFVTHGGYNSISESIVHGVPMICRPVFADQMMMARIVENFWGIGVKVEEGVITKNGLLRDLELCFGVDDERGKKIRENVKELKRVVLMAALPNGGAASDFNKLMEIISMA